MRNFKIVIVFVFGLMVGFTLSLFVIKPSQERVEQTESNFSASLMVDSGEQIVVCQEDLENGVEISSVFKLLEKCSQDNDFSISYDAYDNLGILVTEINGKSSSEDGYWQYWVNNKYANMSSDNYELSNGDVVLWKLTGQIFE